VHKNHSCSNFLPSPRSPSLHSRPGVYTAPHVFQSHLSRRVENEQFKPVAQRIAPLSPFPTTSLNHAQSFITSLRPHGKFILPGIYFYQLMMTPSTLFVVAIHRAHRNTPPTLRTTTHTRFGTSTFVHFASPALRLMLNFDPSHIDLLICSATSTHLSPSSIHQNQR
jgi:hypothetical protein